MNSITGVYPGEDVQRRLAEDETKRRRRLKMSVNTIEFGDIMLGGVLHVSGKIRSDEDEIRA